MDLYHFSTWYGTVINDTRVVVPSKRYAEWAPQTLLNEWPGLIFLTTRDDWEPSVQSFSADSLWEKCGSCPSVYTELGIPCWRFKINPNSIILGETRDFVTDEERWWIMIDDAIKLGSDPEDWRIAVQDCYVIESCKWENNKWLTL